MTSRVALGALLLGAGVAWLLTKAGVLDLAYETWIGIFLVAIGLAILLTPGRHVLLAVLGVLVLLAGLPALVVDRDVLQGGVGDASESPSSRAQLEPYHHGIGKLTIDLTAPGLQLDGAKVKATVGVGELDVSVPPDTDVKLDAHVGIGNVQAFGHDDGGFDVDVQRLSSTSGSQEMRLTVDVGIGSVRVLGP
jgi:predicted membrane protein